MANVKISQLPVTGTPSTTGLIPIVQNGTTFSTTAEDLVALAAGGVTSFNTRDGAVTLQSGDVTGALGFTPANAANVVPNTRELTINGVTQDLSANRTFTVATGAATYPFTGSNIAAGDPVVINDDGTISSVNYQTYAVPSADTGLWDSAINGAYNLVSGNKYSAVTAVNPNNPSQIVTCFVDFNNILWGYISQVAENGQPFNDIPTYGALLNIYAGVSTNGPITVRFDPFYKDRILVMCNDTANNLIFQYIYINNVFEQNNYVPVLNKLFGPNSITGINGTYSSFHFSEIYPNLITMTWANTNNSNYPMVASVLFYQSTQSFFYILGATTYISTSFGLSGNTQGEMGRLEGEDKFTNTYSFYDSSLPTPAYVSYNYIWEFGAYDGNAAPAIVVSGPYNLINSSLPAYSNGVYSISTKFIDSSRIAFGFWRYSGMDILLGIVVASYSGTTVSSVGIVSDSTPYVYPNQVNSSSIAMQQFAYDKNYMLFTFSKNDGTYSNAYGNVVKITGTTPSSFSSDVQLFFPLSTPNNTFIQAYLPNAFAINYSKDGVANLFFVYMASSNIIYSANVPFTYVDQKFNSETLLGIAQNTVVTSGTVEVLPFGGVDENQTGLTTGTYYLQSDGTLTQNVTPYLFGRALSATAIKTTNYPTI